MIVDQTELREAIEAADTVDIRAATARRKLLQVAGWTTSSRLGALWLWSRDWTFYNDRHARDKGEPDSYTERISVPEDTAVWLTRQWLLEQVAP